MKVEATNRVLDVPGPGEDPESSSKGGGLEGNEAIAAPEGSQAPDLRAPKLQQPLAAAQVEIVRLQNRNRELEARVAELEARAGELALKAGVLQEEGLSLLEYIARTFGDDGGALPLAATKGLLATLHGDSTWRKKVHRDPPRRRSGLFRRKRRR
jgi:hypothetical protein